MSKDYGTNRIKRSGTFLILLSMMILSLALSGCGSGGIKLFDLGDDHVRRYAAVGCNGRSFRSVFRGVHNRCKRPLQLWQFGERYLYADPVACGIYLCPVEPAGFSLRE